jgi:phytoene dehydrogenase-like protein
MTLRRHPPLWRDKDGSYRVELGSTERAVLRELPEQLRQAVAANPKDQAFKRLFPPAYEKDPAAEAEYRKLVGHELSEEKLLALETLAKTADAKELTQEQLDTWMRALNDIRLWLGTVLQVTEDQELPDDPPHALYHMLTWVQSLAVDALSGAK